MEKEYYITILGLGNILLGDEGFGVHFINRLAARYCFPERVACVDGGTLGYVLLDTLSSSQIVIVIDVIKISDTPGSLYRFTHEEFVTRMPPPTSAHEVKFSDVLVKAELLDELPDMIFICIVPESYNEMDLEMTPVMHSRMADVERLVLCELEKLGIKPERKSDA